MNNAAVTTTLADRISDLGGVPADRVPLRPPPGEATIDDLIQLKNQEGKTSELVDGTLVEKAKGVRESLLAAVLIQWLRNYLDHSSLRIVLGPDAMVLLFDDTSRAPDVAFYAWSKLPDGKIPDQAVPFIVPDLAIEILSVGNTRAEMARKRREYFHAGVKLVWMIDPRRRTVAVYHAAERVTVVGEEDHRRRVFQIVR